VICTKTTATGAPCARSRRHPGACAPEEVRRICPAPGCSLDYRVKPDGTLTKHVNDYNEPCNQEE
jgi:hypothetical protein